MGQTDGRIERERETQQFGGVGGQAARARYVSESAITTVDDRVGARTARRTRRRCTAVVVSVVVVTTPRR